MPKAMKKLVREQSPPPSDDHNPTDSAEDSDSDHNQDPDVSFRLWFHPIRFLPCLCCILRDPK